ncbi:MAG: hypothetical protein ACT4NY_01445 [Pseudonocardiales bacterium]
MAAVPSDRETKPLGRDLEDALAKVRDLLDIVGHGDSGRLRLAHHALDTRSEVVYQHRSRRRRVPAQRCGGTDR